MEFYAFHGHYVEEQIVGNKFLIDLLIETDLTVAAAYAAGKTSEVYFHCRPVDYYGEYA
jgi:dihydroneopterin aldolase